MTYQIRLHHTIQQLDVRNNWCIYSTSPRKMLYKVSFYAEFILFPSNFFLQIGYYIIDKEHSIS